MSHFAVNWRPNVWSDLDAPKSNVVERFESYRTVTVAGLKQASFTAHFNRNDVDLGTVRHQRSQMRRQAAKPVSNEWNKRSYPTSWRKMDNLHITSRLIRRWGRRCRVLTVVTFDVVTWPRTKGARHVNHLIRSMKFNQFSNSNGQSNTIQLKTGNFKKHFHSFFLHKCSPMACGLSYANFGNGETIFDGKCINSHPSICLTDSDTTPAARRRLNRLPHEPIEQTFEWNFNEFWLTNQIEIWQNGGTYGRGIQPWPSRGHRQSVPLLWLLLRAALLPLQNDKKMQSVKWAKSCR